MDITPENHRVIAQRYFMMDAKGKAMGLAVQSRPSCCLCESVI